MRGAVVPLLRQTVQLQLNFDEIERRADHGGHWANTGGCNHHLQR